MSSIIPSPSKGAVSSVTNGNGLTLSSGTLSMGAASSGAAGAMSAADKTKLDAQSGANTGDVTVSSPTGWLSLVGQALTFALVAASDTVAGVVSLGAQTFAGVKTFTNGLISSAVVTINSYLLSSSGGVTLGVGPASVLNSVAPGLKYDGTSLGLFNTNGAAGLWFNTSSGLTGSTGGMAAAGDVSAGFNFGSGTYGTRIASGFGGVYAQNGTGATDVCMRLGTATADASVNASAHIASVGTGIGGTYVEQFYWTKTLAFLGGSSSWAINNSFATNYLGFQTAGTSVFALMNTGIARSGYGFDVNPAFGAYLSFQVTQTGLMNQRGTDSTGTPGAATIDRPIGKSAIAAGASSVVITNNLVTAASHIVITPHARDATCKELIAVPAAGSFTVSGTANATAALPFSWRVATLLTA